MSIIVISGPTACGKTAVAIKLAKIIDGEIISADSMQIYRGMDIGTAKPSIAEREGIPHHMLDVASPHEDFSAARFGQMAREVIADIQLRDKIPILAGGTGFYIKAALDEDFLASENDDESIRKKLELLDSKILYERLKEADPRSAERIHPNNIKRVIRALAYYETHGRPFSANEQKEQQHKANITILHRDRAKLYEAINRRVEDMIQLGLVEEVKQLIESGLSEGSTAIQALGYKEFLPYFRNECNLEEVKANIKQGSRRYAKRQLTWFRNQIKGANWLSMDNLTAEAAAIEIMKEANFSFFQQITNACRKEGFARL